MRNLNRLTNAASAIQAKTDYAWLLNLAAEIGLAYLIPPAGERPGHRAFDRAARQGVENLLARRPDLREVVARVYPNFIEEDERERRENAPLIRPEGKCVTLPDSNGVEWKL